MSQNLSLNFARVPFRNDRLPRLLYGLSAASLIVVTLVHMSVLAGYLMQEQQELDVRVATLAGELRDLGNNITQAQEVLSSRRSAGRSERIQFLATLYRQKNFSWTGLLNELEAIMPAAVRITSVSPREDDGEINVSLAVVGRTLSDVLEMIQQLERSELFENVHPLDEMKEDGEVLAMLTLTYVAPPPPDLAEPLSDETAETDDPAELEQTSESGSDSPGEKANQAGVVGRPPVEE